MLPVILAVGGGLLAVGAAISKALESAEVIPADEEVVIFRRKKGSEEKTTDKAPEEKPAKPPAAKE